ATILHSERNGGRLSHPRSLSSTRLIRSFNAASILQVAYREGSVTRSRLTELTRMSPSTVTRIVSELIERGILVEMGLEESSGGRKPITLRLNHAHLFVLGGQLLRDQSGVALANLRGEILARRLSRPYSLQPKALIEELAQEVHHLLERE